MTLTRPSLLGLAVMAALQACTGQGALTVSTEPVPASDILVSDVANTKAGSQAASRPSAAASATSERADTAGKDQSSVSIRTADNSDRLGSDWEGPRVGTRPPDAPQ